MKNRTARGFTLIETIVVLGIVAALTALIFGALGPARESARRSGCMSNMHQWGKAFSMYISDWDGQEPILGQQMTHAQLGLPAGVQATLFMQTYHLGNSPVGYCPSMHYSTVQSTKARRMTSYWTPGLFAENIFPDLPTIIADRGPAFPLLVCEMHNADTDFPHQPSWAHKNVQVLRIDQQVIYENVPVRTGNFYE